MYFRGFFACLSLFMWQHLGRLWHWSFRPSDIVTYTAIFSECLCINMGKVLAFISSYMHMLYIFLDLNLKDVYLTLVEGSESLGRFMVSPIFLFDGYYRMALTYTHPGLIVIGSFVLIMIIISVLWQHVLTDSHRQSVKKIIVLNDFFFFLWGFGSVSIFLFYHEGLGKILILYYLCFILLLMR